MCMICSVPLIVIANSTFSHPTTRDSLGVLQHDDGNLLAHYVLFLVESRGSELDDGGAGVSEAHHAWCLCCLLKDGVSGRERRCRVRRVEEEEASQPGNPFMFVTLPTSVCHS